VSYWFKLDPNWDWGTTEFEDNNKFLSNIKVFRMWNPSDNPIHNENFFAAYTGWDNRIMSQPENVGDNGETALGNARGEITLGKWHQFQFEYLENSVREASDGQFRMWFDGTLVQDRNDLVTREDFDLLKRPRVIGFDNSWHPEDPLADVPDPSDDRPNNFLIDDIYVDTSWARIELADAPLYADITQTELQPLLASWSPTSASFRLNQGSFSPGSTAYLYLTDQDGNVNTLGFPVRIVPEPSSFLIIAAGVALMLHRRKT
jgi:hypothetical protein